MHVYLACILSQSLQSILCISNRRTRYGPPQHPTALDKQPTIAPASDPLSFIPLTNYRVLGYPYRPRNTDFLSLSRPSRPQLSFSVLYLGPLRKRISLQSPFLPSRSHDNPPSLGRTSLENSLIFRFPIPYRSYFSTLIIRNGLAVA